MSARAIADRYSRPKLVAHRQLRFDKMRGSWTIQAPERAYLLDEIAHQIVLRCDGESTVERIIDDLCQSFADAPRDVIAADVLKFVQDFADKGVMEL